MTALRVRFKKEMVLLSKYVMSSQTKKNLIFFCILGVLFFSPLGHSLREKLSTWLTPVNKFMLSAPNLTRMEDDFKTRKGIYVLNSTVETAQNETIDLNSLKGKAIFLTLWNYTDISSTVMLPTIQKLYSHYKQNDAIAFLIVSENKNFEEAIAFAKGQNYTFPIFNAVEIDSNLKTHITPTTALINKEGQLVYLDTGSKNWNDEKVILALDILMKQ